MIRSLFNRRNQFSVLFGIIILGLIVTISISSAYAFLAPTFLFKIPSVPSGQFSNPFGVGVDGSDNIYVADTFRRTVHVFDNTGASLFNFGTSFPGGSSLPFDVAIDSTGRIIVTNCPGHLVVFDPGGNFRFTIAGPGSGPGQLGCSEGLTVDRSDNIYVADSSNGRIQVFDNTGALQFIIGPSFPGGSFGYPESVAIDSNGRIIVTDLQRTTVSVFDRNGIFQFAFGGSGSGDGQFFRPAGVDVDSSDNIYVSDISRKDVQIFDKNGVFLAKFGGPGSGDGQFLNPWDLAIDKSGHIVVVDVNKRQVQVFETSISDITPPEITASLVPICGEDDEGLFRVEFSATDESGVGSITATLNGITVTNGQIVELELDDEEEVEFEDGILEIEASSFTLDVTATDNAPTPNTSTESVIPSFGDQVECDDNDDDEDDDDDENDDDDEDDDD